MYEYILSYNMFYIYYMLYNNYYIIYNNNSYYIINKPSDKIKRQMHRCKGERERESEGDRVEVEIAIARARLCRQIAKELGPWSFDLRRQIAKVFDRLMELGASI